MKELYFAPGDTLASIGPTTSAGPAEVVPAFDEPTTDPVVEQYGPLEVAQNWGRASGRFTGDVFAIQADGTLRCPADKTLRPQERRTEADGTLRLVYRAKQADCRSCALASDCLGRQTSGDHPRRVSAVRKRLAQPGGMQAALVHEEALRLDPASKQRDVLWCDLPGYRIRYDYVLRLRRQRVTIVELHASGAEPVLPAVPRIWTRAERAHRRLSWAARLARNQFAAGPFRSAFTVCGVAPALAAYLGLSPHPPG